MKKIKLLKRIEELEVLNTKLENKYKHLLYIDDRFTILMMRQLYENEKNLENLLLKAYATGIPEWWKEKKYCKESKMPILRLDKLVTILMNGQRVFRYDKKTN